MRFLLNVFILQTKQIPDHDVGMCIGKSGCVIREMQQRTQTRIQIPSQATPGQIYRLATVTGPAEGCQKIQEIIARISNEQSSQFVMTGECFQQGGQQGQQAYGQQQAYGSQGQQQYGAAAGQQGQQGGQQDYSAQWAAYYAAQATQGGSGGAQQAASTAVAATATAASTGASGAASGGADQYYEDFFRYAYHYGEEAARKAYAAWAPPEGTPNPYGTNPSAGSASGAPAPAPSAAATSTPAAASYDPKQHKDSSVRKLSNLPAWMTKS